MSLEGKLKEVLRLVAETGDRCIVVSEESDPFVVMGLDSYRSLLQAAATRQNLSELSEHELLDSINQQIAEWRETSAAKMREYDLSQFVSGQMSNAPAALQEKRLEAKPMAPAPVSAGKRDSRPSFRTMNVVQPRQADEANVTNLPTVPGDELSEYQLEPLS